MSIKSNNLPASNQQYRKYLDYLGLYTDGGLRNSSGNKDFTMSGLMKAIASHACRLVHFEVPEDEEAQLSPEANDDDNDDETEGYLQVNTDLLHLNEMYGSHSSCRTQCAQTLKAMIGELSNNESTNSTLTPRSVANALGEPLPDKVWKTAVIFTFLLENCLRIINWHRDIPWLNRKLPSEWIPCESALCMLLFNHPTPGRRIQVVKMSEGTY